MQTMTRTLAALAVAALLPAQANACGQDSNCQLGDRVYRIAMPEDARAPVGALIFNHGYRGSHKGAMKNKALIAFAHAQGMALVSTKSASTDWLIPGVPENQAETGDREFAYFDALRDALVSRHGIDGERLVATGYSAGGMMTWNLACHRAGAFAGFVPVAGTFWEPVPSTCPSGPAQLVHVHGTSDKIVPLTGRPIGPTHQGSIFEALEMAAGLADYGDRVPVPAGGDLSCAARTSSEGSVLGFCTHPGGHSFKVAYLEQAFEMLRAAGALPPTE